MFRWILRFGGLRHGAQGPADVSCELLAPYNTAMRMWACVERLGGGKKWQDVAATQLGTMQTICDLLLRGVAVDHEVAVGQACAPFDLGTWQMTGCDDSLPGTLFRLRGLFAWAQASQFSG